MCGLATRIGTPFQDVFGEYVLRLVVDRFESLWHRKISFLFKCVDSGSLFNIRREFFPYPMTQTKTKDSDCPAGCKLSRDEIVISKKLNFQFNRTHLVADQ